MAGSGMEPPPPMGSGMEPPPLASSPVSPAPLPGNRHNSFRKAMSKCRRLGRRMFVHIEKKKKKKKKTTTKQKTKQNKQTTPFNFVSAPSSLVSPCWLHNYLRISIQIFHIQKDFKRSAGSLSHSFDPIVEEMVQYWDLEFVIAITTWPVL